MTSQAVQWSSNDVIMGEWWRHNACCHCHLQLLGFHCLQMWYFHEFTGVLIKCIGIKFTSNIVLSRGNFLEISLMIVLWLDIQYIFCEIVSPTGNSVSQGLSMGWLMTPVPRRTGVFRASYWHRSNQIASYKASPNMVMQVQIRACSHIGISVLEGTEHWTGGDHFIGIFWSFLGCCWWY